MAFKFNTGFLSFKIKAIAKEPKKEKKPSNASLVLGLIIQDNDEYLVKVKTIKDSKVEEEIYKLTDESYSLYDKTVVYSRKPDKRGRYTAILKTHNDAKLWFEGKNPFYVPFKPNLKVKGKLKAINGIKYFDLVESCNPESYVSF